MTKTEASAHGIRAARVEAVYIPGTPADNIFGEPAAPSRTEWHVKTYTVTYETEELIERKGWGTHAVCDTAAEAESIVTDINTAIA